MFENIHSESKELYKKYTENTDFSNLEDVISKVNLILNEKDFVIEQKLHAIGLIIDRNKETYIRHIKDEYFKLQKKIEESENGNLVIINEVQAKQITSLCKKINKIKKLVQENKYLMIDNMRLREELDTIYNGKKACKKIKVLKKGVIVSESNADKKL